METLLQNELEGSSNLNLSSCGVVRPPLRTLTNGVAFVPVSAIITLYFTKKTIGEVCNEEGGKEY